MHTASARGVISLSYTLRLTQIFLYLDFYSKTFISRNRFNLRCISVALF